MSLHPSSKVIQKVVENEADLIKEVCNIIFNLANKAILNKGSFNVGLSGGSLIKFLCEGLPALQTDWLKWNFFFCDERIVPTDDKESTFGAYSKHLAEKIPSILDQFVTVDTSLDVTSAAQDYENKLRKTFPDCEWPSFDLLLLGMGPDGHTASLFPGHPLLDEATLWVAPISDSPKPPPNRVTMTLPVLNHSKACLFALSGQGKADMLKRILVDKEDLPCGRVKPEGGELFWLMDKAAASSL